MNAPLLLGMRALVMRWYAATAWCSSVGSLSGHALDDRRLFRDANLPQSVLQVVTPRQNAAPQLVESLIAHPAVRRVNFTGSTRVGRMSGTRWPASQACAAGTRRQGAAGYPRGRRHRSGGVCCGLWGFRQQGQICMSTERIVVDERIADAFAQRLANKAFTLRASDKAAISTRLGCLIGGSAAERVEELVADAVARGATLLTSLRREGVWLEPLVIDRVRPGMRLYEEESFGPIAALVRVRDADEAVEIANDTEYGLAGAVFGRDLARTLSWRNACRWGSATETHHRDSEPQLPFGGSRRAVLVASGASRRSPNSPTSSSSPCTRSRRPISCDSKLLDPGRIFDLQPVHGG